jgi:hypothetical protein
MSIQSRPSELRETCFACNFLFSLFSLRANFVLWRGGRPGLFKWKSWRRDGPA